MNTGMTDGLVTNEKIVFALLALLFHLILLTILILIISIDIILKKNILNKLRKNLLNQWYNRVIGISSR